MKTQEILSIVALSLLGLCLLCGLAKMAMKGDSAKKNCDKACSMAVFAAVVLLAISQLIGETDGYSDGVTVKGNAGTDCVYPVSATENKCVSIPETQKCKNSKECSIFGKGWYCDNAEGRKAAKLKLGNAPYTNSCAYATEEVDGGQRGYPYSYSTMPKRVGKTKWSTIQAKDSIGPESIWGSRESNWSEPRPLTGGGWHGFNASGQEIDPRAGSYPGQFADPRWSAETPRCMLNPMTDQWGTEIIGKFRDVRDKCWIAVPSKGKYPTGDLSMSNVNYFQCGGLSEWDSNLQCPSPDDCGRIYAPDTERAMGVEDNDSAYESCKDADDVPQCLRDIWKTTCANSGVAPLPFRPEHGEILFQNWTTSNEL